MNRSISTLKTSIAILFAAATLIWSHPALGGPIHTAASRGDIKNVKALLAENPDLVSSKDEHGWTPLYWAAASGHKEVVDLLIASNADVNALNQHFTPLRAAVLNHHQDVADLLIAHNAQATIFDAAAGGYIEIVKEQLKANPSLAFATDDSGGTALHFGARNGREDVVELLLAYKADVNAKNRIGMTPLQTAFAFGAGPRPVASRPASRDADYEGIAELLIANGADVTSRNNSGLTALHYAASAGFTNLIIALLDRNADINAKDNRGRTPLDSAAQSGRMDVVQLLLARGADMDAKDKAGLMALKDAERRVQVASPSSAYEYEVDGFVSQTIPQFSGTNRYASASFTVYVRDCGWLIATAETNEAGGMVAREIGSTNGTEIYECTHGLSGFGHASGTIQSNNVPVGETDSAVVGHLWLMFASRCYWSGLNSDQLTPVYDWRASVAASSTGFGNHQKVSADWELLNGNGSLPREVRYLDVMNRTNAIYTITGTNSVGGMLFPTGFVFQQFNGDRFIKRVAVQVTAIRPVCSRASLIPLPNGRITIVDRRFDNGLPNRPASYQNPVIGQWPTFEEARGLVEANKADQLRNLARAGISPFPETKSPSPSPEKAVAPVLSLSIRCTNDLVKAGDEIDIEFRITNVGTNDYRYENRTYDRSGRMNEYQLVATNSSGEAVPDPRASNKWGWFGGGLFQYATLKPGESFTKTIPLNRWALVKAPGRYEVVGTYFSSAYGTNVTTVHADPISITVQPRTPQEMDAYTSDLTNQLEAKLTGKPTPANESRPPDPEVNALVMKLMFTCSPKIVPSLLKSMCDDGSGGGFWEHEAIMYYVPRSEETKDAILAAATVRGIGRNWSLASLLREYGFTREELKPLIERALSPDNEPGWAVGAGLAQEFPDDAFITRLIAIAKIPRSNARTAAIAALAAHRTDEGVKTLKSLLDDPHKEVWTPLANALLNGYRAGVFRPDDFPEQNVKPLVERMLTAGGQSPDVITAVSLLEQFGSDHFTSQLIAIATDSGNIAWQGAVYALALNRTDEGLKTLKALLNSSDSKIQKVAGDAIRHAYTDRGKSRGRPLKPEDFDRKYQQPE